jgi:fatty-acyl-CoA synthase
VTGADKIDKKPLRANAWITTDDVWWRPRAGGAYRRLDGSDVAELARELARNGRTNLLTAR